MCKKCVLLKYGDRSDGIKLAKHVLIRMLKIYVRRFALERYTNDPGKAMKYYKENLKGSIYNIVDHMAEGTNPGCHECHERYREYWRHAQDIGNVQTMNWLVEGLFCILQLEGLETPCMRLHPTSSGSSKSLNTRNIEAGGLEIPPGMKIYPLLEKSASDVFQTLGKQVEDMLAAKRIYDGHSFEKRDSDSH